MNKYEVMIIFQPELDEKQIQDQIKNFKDKVSLFEGKIISEDIWGLRNLAYQIKKKTKGYYFISNFELEKSKVSDLSNWLRFENEAVLRNMITVIN